MRTYEVVMRLFVEARNKDQVEEMAEELVRKHNLPDFAESCGDNKVKVKKVVREVWEK